LKGNQIWYFQVVQLVFYGFGGIAGVEVVLPAILFQKPDEKVLREVEK